MKNLIYIFSCFLLMSCNSEPTLQKYFVENTENKNFIAVDLTSNILNVDKAKLSAEQNEALKSFEKMNILAFKLNEQNKAEYNSEKQKLNSILKNPEYQQLMKFGSGNDGATVSYIGADDHINEFVFYGNKKDAGFVIMRVLGKDMNPNSIMTMISVIQQSNINLDQLKPLEGLMK